eukprot:jgi/Ulvmu1/977/UM103_0004.1
MWHFDAIRSLEISGPQPSKESSRIVRTLVMVTPYLTHLDLSATGVGRRYPCSIRVPDTHPLPAALARLRCLRHLSLASNGIDDGGALSVLGVLGCLPELDSVDLRCNSVSIVQGLYESEELVVTWTSTRASARCPHSMHSTPGEGERERTPECGVDLSEICFVLFP